MKNVVVLLLLLGVPVCLPGQCQTVVSSSDGYNVHISLTPISLATPDNCPNGYNFNVVIDYDIYFSGTNIPSSLYTLQGYIDCTGNPDNFFPLPNSGGIGSASSATTTTTDTDCATATPESRGCDHFDITIDGPGIPTQTVGCSVALPAEIGYFHINKKDEKPFLQWVTYSETNNDYFEILHSTTGQAWEPVGMVKGAGNSFQPNYYSFIHPDADPGDNFYRLKQVDYDGSFVLTDIQIISLGEQRDIYVSPNPFENTITIAGNQNIGEFQVYNAIGKNVMNQAEVTVLHENKFTLNFSGLQPGIYYLVNSKNSFKLVKI